MRILLHICCGVCAAGAVQELKAQGHSVTGFFYNPNIYPEEEYHRRLGSVQKAAEQLGFELYIGKYDHNEWLSLAGKFKEEPEGARRCEICFHARIKRTYEHFLNGDFDAFTTTLTIGPMKNASLINDIGSRLAGNSFLQADFKKKDGFKKAMELARAWELYRQNYCGCEWTRDGVTPHLK
ncbi:MAG: epoxyqueuosine reductase QueH [Candidatus Omnitrophica bacterium]|nr:epoxyqueuosine reductase QueH [Candidatus Omnitrophota bacterium]MBU1128520.1 epoxyqueuosine reductase QueH [Candidatus Omnitrophota bacterium]MBU1656780.1 epoxyqueuosine reductase QueH [Candidatus Omnitrophota bacterium]MBU1784452.1 epoxyqueuosine reductase QueH [Candidatus Omnitrophota bacterium]MBU1851351.1 epoxyqueuosine reductase QueH [Candidatus Omnitrophota bacterium]